VQVRGNFEARVQEQLRALKIEDFLPVYVQKVRWSDRLKTIERPLFPGYLFARVADPGLVAPILAVPGVVGFLPNNLRPEVINDLEVETIAKLCFSELPLLAAEYKRGQTVTIQAGVLAGVSGIISKVRNTHRLTVNIEIFHRAVEVELDAEAVASCR
jgi:transcription antitermination factor NusG